MKTLSVLLVFLSLAILSCENSSSEPEPKILTYQLKGKIMSVSQTPINMVEVSIFEKDGSIVLKDVLTTSSGEFQFSLPPGLYRVEVSHAGYDKFVATIELQKDLELDPITLAGKAAISGTIINSQTAKGLAGAMVSFIRQDQLSIGYSEPEFVVITNDTGYYKLEGLPTGTFIGYVEKEGNFKREMSPMKLEEGDNTVKDIVSVEKPASGGIRIVLTWGETPLDLDAHILGIHGDTKYHVYYHDKEPTPSVKLDVDVQKGFGPETMTIKQLNPGVYKYFVHDYNNGLGDAWSGVKMAKSPTVVELYDADHLIQSFLITDPGAGVNVVNLFELIVNDSGSMLLNVTNTWSMDFPYGPGWGGRAASKK